MKLKLTFDLDSPRITEETRQGIQRYLACADERHMFWAEMLAEAIEQTVSAVRRNLIQDRCLREHKNIPAAFNEAKRIYDAEYATYVLLETAKVEIE